MQMKQDSHKSAQDNRADQLNPQHPKYHLARGETPASADALANAARKSPSDAQKATKSK